MINVFSGHELYSVRFFYASGNGFKTKGRAALANVHKKRIKTTCEICVKDDNGQYLTIAKGDSIKMPQDMFNKGTGRRISLGNALKNIGAREIRYVIWDAYAHAHKDGHMVKKLDEVAE